MSTQTRNSRSPSGAGGGAASSVRAAWRSSATTTSVAISSSLTSPAAYNSSASGSSSCTAATCSARARRMAAWVLGSVIGGLLLVRASVELVNPLPDPLPGAEGLDVALGHEHGVAAVGVQARFGAVERDLVGQVGNGSLGPDQDFLQDGGQVELFIIEFDPLAVLILHLPAGVDALVVVDPPAARLALGQRAAGCELADKLDGQVAVEFQQQGDSLIVVGHVCIPF